MGVTVVVPLAPGFEEIEAVTIIDVLRRADVHVIVAGLDAGPVEGSHGIRLATDQPLADLDAAGVAAVVLPGGMPGSKHLAESPRVQELLVEVASAGGYTCAICAAPIALAAAGVHEAHTLTSYPGFQSRLPGATYAEQRVVVDRRVVTSRGPGTALEFALTLVGLLVGAEAEEKLTQAMIVTRPEPATII